MPTQLQIQYYMCNYNISVDDKLMTKARRAFKNEQAITLWMQQQIEQLLQQVVDDNETDSQLMYILQMSEERAAAGYAVPHAEVLDRLKNYKYGGSLV